MKIDDALEELKDTWGYDGGEIAHIRELMEEVGATCYGMGYHDRKLDEKVERREFAEMTLGGYHPPIDGWDS